MNSPTEEVLYDKKVSAGLMSQWQTSPILWCSAWLILGRNSIRRLLSSSLNRPNCLCFHIYRYSFMERWFTDSVYRHVGNICVFQPSAISLVMSNASSVRNHIAHGWWDLHPNGRLLLILSHCASKDSASIGRWYLRFFLQARYFNNVVVASIVYGISLETHRQSALFW